MMLVGLERDLVSDIGVKASASLCCNEATADGGHSVLPVVPGISKFLFTKSEGSFFSNETAMVIDISK